ncbi:unnamed protein product [marine sediment metagenome]|uniref:Uncharacterized protein n=1 Tax=marine sediment metagenome TaxID=412755 RepID=X1L829_9ZZZZ
MPGISWVNMFQTSQERREKYHLLRSIGISVAWARRGMDWHLSSIERIYSKELGLNSDIVLPAHKVKHRELTVALDSVDKGAPHSELSL